MPLRVEFYEDPRIQPGLSREHIKAALTDPKRLVINTEPLGEGNRITLLGRCEPIPLFSLVDDMGEIPQTLISVRYAVFTGYADIAMVAFAWGATEEHFRRYEKQFGGEDE